MAAHCAHALSVTYYKRFRMEIDLDGVSDTGMLPRSFYWISWDESMLEVHAEVKYRSFVGEIDAEVFPALGDPYGCRRLMCEIRRRAGFLPGATWLIACPAGYVGTIQGVMDQGPIGAIQNVGVVRSHRGLGLGQALVRRALAGFADAGLRRAYLEVTAENVAAVQLYRNVGFRRSKTLYKAVNG
jgi:ribosomal protein S18 acetylase RimI-like enzyme